MSVAAEHVAWCRSRGQRPAEIIAAVGLPASGASSWDDATMAVEHAWLHLPSDASHRFAAQSPPEARQGTKSRRPARVGAAKAKKRRRGK